MIAIFAALYTALRIIPTVPMIGTGATFHLSDILAPLYGILLGPFVGGAAILIGTFAAIGLGSSMPFLGLDFLPAFVVAVSLGLLVRKKWLPVVILNAALMLLFALDPFTVNLIETPVGPFPFTWMHITAFIVLILLGRKAGNWVKSQKPILLTAGFAILAFTGTMMQHLTGNLLFETVFGNVLGYMDTAAFATTWNLAFYLYPLERLALIIGAIVVGVPVTKALQKFLHNANNKSSV
jgi:hypothetical protein